MSFVYPNFLWAYFLIAIPIVIHLFNFRRYKTVYFSRVAFLKEVTEDSKSGTKLKHLLILLSRILAILALVTAFAQPFVPVDDSKTTSSATSIYIDNSFSMQAEGSDGNLLNETKNQAIELVKTFDPNEKINLLSADLLSKHQRFYTKSEVIEMIKELDFSSKSTSLDNAMNLQMDLLNGLGEDNNKRLFIFSDFQKKTSDLANWTRPEISTYYYQAVPEQKGNIYIDSVWFESPVHKVNTPQILNFRIYNLTDVDQKDLPINLKINGSNSGPKRVSISANSFVDEQITFTDVSPGLKQGELTVATSQLFFDDSYFFSYEIKEEVKILLITNGSGTNKNIEQLYSLDNYYNATVRSINDVSQEDFEGQELVLFQNVNKIPSGLADLSEGILKAGGSVVLIPGDDIDLESWNNLMLKHNLPTYGLSDSINAAVNYFNSTDPLYSGVFESTPSNYQYPKIYAGYNFNIISENNFITLFGTNEINPYPFMFYAKRLNGRIVAMRSPLNPGFTNFQNHALFAATFLRIAETATFDKPLFLEIGELKNFPINVELDDKNPIHLMNSTYEVDAIPQIVNVNSTRSISFNHLEDIIKNAGVYELTDSKNFNENIAINYNRNESLIEPFTSEEIENMFKEIGWEKAKELTLNDSGSIEIKTYKAKEYWRILLILALVFIAIEIALLKFWKS